MKYTLTVETDDLEDLRQHITAGDLRHAIFQFDNDLRALVKYGGTDCRNLRADNLEDGLDAADKIRQHLHRILDDCNVSDVVN